MTFFVIRASSFILVSGFVIRDSLSLARLRRQRLVVVVDQLLVWLDDGLAAAFDDRGALARGDAAPFLHGFADLGAGVGLTVLACRELALLGGLAVLLLLLLLTLVLRLLIGRLGLLLLFLAGLGRRV